TERGKEAGVAVGGAESRGVVVGVHGVLLLVWRGFSAAVCWYSTTPRPRAMCHKSWMQEKFRAGGASGAWERRCRERARRCYRIGARPAPKAVVMRVRIRRQPRLTSGKS